MAISQAYEQGNGVSTHSRLKAAGFVEGTGRPGYSVSTHSRLKAAGDSIQRIGINSHGFNTQPPKGGWNSPLAFKRVSDCFNTQPPKGGWKTKPDPDGSPSGFNTQPPKGGWMLI